MTDAYKLLKNTCARACHDRHACVNGYKQMLAATNVSQMMATWRDNWEDVVEGKFADIICTELPRQYPLLKDEMNKAGIYLNECPENAQFFILVLVTDCDKDISIRGKASAYILGEATVSAYGHAQVYSSRCDKARIFLHDYAYGNIKKGKVVACDRSRLECSSVAMIDGCVECTMKGGEAYVVACKQLYAYNRTIVYSSTSNRIHIDESSQLKPYQNEQQTCNPCE